MSFFRRPLWPMALPVSVAVMAAGLPAAALCGPAPPAAPMDLQGPFHTRSPWKLVVGQGPATEDYGGNPAPGALDLCLQKSPVDPGQRTPVAAPSPDPAAFPDWGPHYLGAAKPVYPQGRTQAPLLLLVTSSLHAGDGGQVRVTELLTYDRMRDSFERIYFHSSGTNNNQEVRFIADGPLRGDVISAEPTANAPYGYWITVSRFTPARRYRQAVRYRSTTRYHDGNALAAIDSEMPEIERRLGLWTPGSPLPTPRGAACAKPRLKHRELWCG